MTNRWKHLLLAPMTLCFVACTNRERPVGIAELRDVMELELNGNGSGSFVGFSLHLPASAFDTNNCPVLHDDVKVTVNGVATQLYSRGGSTTDPTLPPFELTHGCKDLAGEVDFGAAPPPLLEVAFSDKDGVISSQVEALLDAPTLALAADQPSEVRPGDTVRLRYTPASSIVEDGTKPLLIGSEQELSRIDTELAEIPRLTFTSADGELRFTVPQRSPGAVQVVLLQPWLEAKTSSCVGAVACVNACEWSTKTIVPLTILAL